jgi:RNA-directed DNA polymerase
VSLKTNRSSNARGGQPKAMPQPRLKNLGFKTVKSLAKAMSVSVDHLEWVATLCRTSYPYACWREPKQSGNGFRLIENPNRWLKRIQQRLNGVFQRLDLPKLFHGSYKGTHVKSNAEPHKGKAHYESFDLADFYHNIRFTRVYQGYFALGCAPNVARILTSLTTVKGHVPQGAPTSPIVAVIALLPVARRLSTLSDKIDATVTIYGDNISVSGPKHVANYTSTLTALLLQSGFKLRKEKRESKDNTQPWLLPGVELFKNSIDIPQAEFAELRSLFEKLIELGSPGISAGVCPRFCAALSGRFYHYRWIGNSKEGLSARAEELKKLFDRIQWPDSYSRTTCESPKCRCVVN